MERQLSDIFAEDYMGKVFYFCLRKTGNEHEAEGLTSDITYNIIAELERGTVPQNFHAWVWRIARNRYSVWAERKRMRRERFADDDVYEYEVADTDTDVEGETVRKDEIARLRRELAFISSEYRNIVVAYYIDGRKVREIADGLGVPTDTVKSRLSRARKILKEGMDMAKEFGVLSYKPENITFVNNGFYGDHGEPWTILDRKLSKNLLLAAYRNPSTPEDLALELGVALPYMEDELRWLVDGTLMRKNGDKYETDCIITSAETQRKIYERSFEIAPKLTGIIIELIEYWVKCQADNGGVWHEGYQSYEDMKWALLMKTVDQIRSDSFDELAALMPEIANKSRTARPNNGRWDILGFEEYTGEMPEFVGQHCSGDGWPYLSHFRFEGRRINALTPNFLEEDEVHALVSVVNGKTDGSDADTLAKLEKYGYIVHDGEGYRPTFWVMFCNKIKPLTEEQAGACAKLAHEAKAIMRDFYIFKREIIKSELPNFIRSNVHQVNTACGSLDGNIRGAVLEEAIMRGYVMYVDDDDDKCMLGASMVI